MAFVLIEDVDKLPPEDVAVVFDSKWHFFLAKVLPVVSAMCPRCGANYLKTIPSGDFFPTIEFACGLVCHKTAKTLNPAFHLFKIITPCHRDSTKNIAIERLRDHIAYLEEVWGNK